MSYTHHNRHTTLNPTPFFLFIRLVCVAWARKWNSFIIITYAWMCVCGVLVGSNKLCDISLDNVKFSNFHLLCGFLLTLHHHRGLKSLTKFLLRETPRLRHEKLQISFFQLVFECENEKFSPSTTNKLWKHESAAAAWIFL